MISCKLSGAALPVEFRCGVSFAKRGIIMSKRKYETASEDLFSKWEAIDHHKNKIFVRDGIIDYKKWLQSKKILVLLKEAYSAKDEVVSWNLPDLIDNKEFVLNMPHFQMLSYWLYVIYSASNKIPLKKLTPEILDKGYEYLLSSAIVNIKKSAGVSTSDKKDLIAWAEKDRDFLNKQIELINPEIILCGNTCDILLKKIFQERNYKDVYVSHYCFEYRDITIIDFWHPARKKGREFEFCKKLYDDYSDYLRCVAKNIK